MTRIYFVASAIVVFFSLDISAHIDANHARLKLYELAVSKSPLCENPIVVYRNDHPVETDVFAGPLMMSGHLDNGVYHCVIIEISDHIVVSPDRTEGSCTAGKEVVTDICDSSLKVEFKLTDGTSGRCRDGEQRVPIYFSTASVNRFIWHDTNGFLPPAKMEDATRGLVLTSPLKVDGALTRTLGIETQGRINEELKTCFYEYPLIYFREYPLTAFRRPN